MDENTPLLIIGIAVSILAYRFYRSHVEDTPERPTREGPVWPYDARPGETHPEQMRERYDREQADRLARRIGGA